MPILAHDGYTNMKNSISPDFRHELGKKANFEPRHVRIKIKLRSIPMVKRWTHVQRVIPEALTKHIRSGSLAYDVDAIGTRRIHGIVRCKIYSRKCPEGIT